MIFGNITQEGTYGFPPRAVRKCFEYALVHDFLGFEKGNHSIDGECLLVNVVRYETAIPEKRFWEAHKKYLDVHLVFDGRERIDLNLIENTERKDFVQKDDSLPLEGESDSHVMLRPGDFLTCYPHDGHRTTVTVDGSKQIKKAIFKVRIDN